MGCEFSRSLAARDASRLRLKARKRYSGFIQRVGREHNINARRAGVGDDVPARVEGRWLEASLPAPGHLQRTKCFIPRSGGLCWQGIKRRASHGVNEARIQGEEVLDGDRDVESYIAQCCLERSSLEGCFDGNFLSFHSQYRYSGTAASSFHCWLEMVVFVKVPREYSSEQWHSLLAFLGSISILRASMYTTSVTSL